MSEELLKPAREALIASQYDQFFLELAKLESSHNRYKLAQEACDVAFQKKNADLLEQIATVKLDKWYEENIFEEVVNTLVKLSCSEKAIALVFNHDGTKLDEGKGWYLLAKAFLRNNELAQAKKTYRYVGKAHKNEIAQGCLAKISLQNDLLEWLYWYGVCELATYSYQKPLIDLLQVIKTIVEYPDFTKVCPLLKNLNTNHSKTLLTKLYLHLFRAGMSDKCAALLKVLPSELQWLSKTAELLEKGESFDILTKFESSDAEFIISTAINSLIQAHSMSADDVLFQAIDNAAQYSQNIPGVAIHACMQQHRPDVAIKLWLKMGEWQRNSLLPILTENELRKPQYEIIIQALESLSAGSIPANFPTEIIEEERKRRQQKLEQQADDLLKKKKTIPPAHSEEFHLLGSAIDQMIMLGKYKKARKYCEAMVVSKARDYCVTKLFSSAIDHKDWNGANVIIELCCKEEVKKVLKGILNSYKTAKKKKPDYRATLCALLEVSNVDDFDSIINLCVQNILKESESDAINFLVGSKIFSRYGFYSSDEGEDLHVPGTIKIIIDAIMRKYPTDESLSKYTETLTQDKKRNLSEFLLRELLKVNRFVAVVVLLNQVSETVQYADGVGKEIPYGQREFLKSYFSTHPIKQEFLKAISDLEDKFFRDDFISKAFEKNEENASKETVELMASIPIAEVRDRYLFEAVISFIDSDDLEMSKFAAQYLSEDIQKKIFRVLFYVEGEEFFPLIEYILAEFAENYRLLWVAVDALLATNLSFGLGRLLRILAKSNVHNARSCYEEVFRYSVQKLLSLKKYNELDYFLFDFRHEMENPELTLSMTQGLKEVLLQKPISKDTIETVHDSLLLNEEAFHIKLVEASIGKSDIVCVYDYLRQVKITTPGTVVRLSSQLKESYLIKLREYLGDEVVNELIALSKKYTYLLQLGLDETKKNDVSLLQDELVVTLRSRLDKQYLTFYREKYGAQFKNIYFPGVPDSFKALEKSDVKKDFPELFDYLSSIQPSKNNDYIWLSQLFRLANKAKHDSEIIVPVDSMQEFLLNAIDGVVEILLKLANYRMPLAEIQGLRFSNYVLIKPSQSLAKASSVHGLLPALSLATVSVPPTEKNLGLSYERTN